MPDVLSANSVVDGYFPLPSGPGLGVALDEVVDRANPQREPRFDLFAEDWQYRQSQTSAGR